MINPFHIIKGWFASKIYTDNFAFVRSKLRLLDCGKCSFTKQSKVLKFINGDANEIETLVCTGCSKNFHCPVVEKSLVKNEKCPKGKWKV